MERLVKNHPSDATTIHVGTCSWTEKTLIESGEFYPKDVTSAEARLRYYASHFDTVEVDSTYYAIPDRRTTMLWIERTHEHFVFHIKAYGALTGHSIDPRSLPKDIRSLLSTEEQSAERLSIRDSETYRAIAERFKDVLRPILDAGKLGVIVFQYPPWFHRSTKNMEYILNAQEVMGDFPVAVEFRHGSWLTEDVRDTIFRFLADHHLTYVAADEPQYGSLATIPFIPEATTDIAYFRFHGRNRENWFKKGVETSLRYAYNYSDREIEDLKQGIERVAKKVKTVYAMFNNCHGSFAVKNAMRLNELFRR